MPAAAVVAQADGAPEHDVLANVSRAIGQLLRERVGKGPAQVRSEWAGDDALLVLLGDVMTTAERTLWNHGRSGTARTYRHAMMESLESDLRSVVERHTGRDVVTLLSATHHEPAVIAEIFLLEPLGGSDSSDAGSGGRRWPAGVPRSSSRR